MTKENTKSLLENIKKKMMKINTPKTTDSQMNFANLDDDFEYIVPKKTDSTNSQNQKQNSELDVKTMEQIKAALSNQVNIDQEPSKQVMVDDEKDLAGDFFANKEGPKLSDLSLAQDLKADLASANKKSENLAVTKESNAPISEFKTSNNSDELDLEGLGDDEDEMDLDLETKKKETKDDKSVDNFATIQKNSMANSMENNVANVVTGDKSNNDTNKDDLDLDLDFDLDEDEDDKQPIAAKNSDEDLDLADLEDLKDDVDLNLEQKQDEGNIVENNKEGSLEEIDENISKDNLLDEEIVNNNSNSLDLKKEDKDLELDIDNDDFNLEGDKKDNQYSDKLPKNDSIMSDQDDIKLNLEDGHDEFLDSKTQQDSSSENSLDDLGEDLTFDQKDELKDSNQEERQNNNPNWPNGMINESMKDNLLSKQTIEKTSNSIKNLMNNFNKKPSSDKNLDSLHTITVEQMMMSMLQPKLEEWLNANLPNLVEKIIREEIAKIIPKN